MMGQAIALFRFALGWLYTLFMSGTLFTAYLVGLGWPTWVALCRHWAQGSLWSVGVRAQVEGQRHLKGPALFVSNHTSLLDVVVLPAILPRRIKWVAKRELLKVPVWGWAFGATGAILIDRRNAREAKARMGTAIRGLPDDTSVVIFPEGTRSRNGALLRFKRGVFHLALASRLPVVPIGIHGARPLVPEGQWWVQAGEVCVTVGEPLPTEGWTPEDLESSMVSIREAVQRCVNASRHRWEKRHGPRAAQDDAWARKAG